MVDTQHGVSDSHLLPILADWVAGGGIIQATQYALQVRGWLRVDRYGSPVLTHAGAEAMEGLQYERQVER